MLARTPSEPIFGYVLAHGAGAGIRHPFLETIAEALGERGAATPLQGLGRTAGRGPPDGAAPATSGSPAPTSIRPWPTGSWRASPRVRGTGLRARATSGACWSR